MQLFVNSCPELTHSTYSLVLFLWMNDYNELLFLYALLLCCSGLQLTCCVAMELSVPALLLWKNDDRPQYVAMIKCLCYVSMAKLSHDLLP